MASITVQAQGSPSGPLRPLNILRDLPQVADLIELCFSSNMDDEGQSYLQQMRHASRDHDFLRWAGQVVDSASLPLSGFVWEENGKIVGNASLVPQSFKGKKIALIANVATHPDYRRRGIGRSLTEKTMAHAREKGAREIWLQVRDDNPTAIKIYADLGFVERARRTTYRFKSEAPISGGLSPAGTRSAQDNDGIGITRPNPHDWPLQHEWLKRAHPDELRWYARWDWDTLGPGIWNWLYRLFIESDTRQWAAVKDGALLATLSWMTTARAANTLWLASRPGGDGSGVRSVLDAARRELTYHSRLTVEYPAGEMVEAIQSAGFMAFRTLVWMCATS
jgi:ribosomal protein S18 acetylase RimI-like enzyme